MSSEKFDNKLIFKKGQIEMHSPSLQREKNFRRTREQAADLTHARNTRKALEGKFLHAPFAQFSVQDTFSFFEKRGLPI